MAPTSVPNSPIEVIALTKRVAELERQLEAAQRDQGEPQQLRERYQTMARLSSSLFFILDNEGVYREFMSVSSVQPLVPPEQLIGRSVREVR